MGIQGLLKFLNDYSENINIKSLKGKSVAIDSYCWLHKGAFAVGDKLVRGEDTNVHIMYCVKYVQLLLSHNIKPILVFDGRHLPAKAETEAKRRESRKIAKQRAIELMKKGQHKEAQNYLRRCVDITHEMALKLIQVCRALNVDCIVAPYEADAQLAYLNKIGLADYVITEDSDLTLFGCRKILFKLDLTGNCVLVDSDRLALAMGCKEDKFTMEKFRLMCILSGCDYVESLPGIGLAKACKFVKATEETDLMRGLDKIPAYLNMRHLTVTDEYKINVLKARATFLHMVVFDPRKRKQVRLHELHEVEDTNEEHCCNAGEIMLDDAKALDLAVGNLNPFTMKKLDIWHPDQRERAKLPTTISSKGLKIAKHSSIWHRNYQFTSLSNGPVPSTAPKAIVKKSPKPPKRVIEAIEDSDEDLPTESQNDDLVLKQYMIEPSSKRFKEDDDDGKTADIEVNGADEQPPKTPETTPNRNPFKKAALCKELLSPTRISRDTNSLVKNQSPVKHIDYSKLEKLSRFTRTGTVLSAKGQPILSRFFGQSSKPKDENDAQTAVKSETVQREVQAEAVPPPVAQMKSPNLLDSCTASPKSTLYYSKSSDSGFSPSNDEPAPKSSHNDDMEDNLSRECQYSILDKFRLVLKEKIDDEPMECQSSQSTYTSDKTDFSETNELPIVLSDNENDIDNSQKGSTSRMWLNGSQKPKTGTKVVPKAKLRKKSASSTKTTSSSNSTDSQSRLSMFGFQKKSVLKH
ncbi:exonuclease 1 [Sitodiplosis mosellana]|uniref:exonuclease 1 n=1 Tax=Sitodiplosis mosellana TaxID=263140 RepID=UPI0024448BF0|nr:exonuclease 1 [Sitodiplosis mosellana]